MQKKLDQLRSQRWFASDDIRGFAHRQRMQQQGLSRDEFMGRPIVGILNTWSDLSPCHAHLRDRAQAIKRGVLQAGGYPLELPAMSLGQAHNHAVSQFSCHGGRRIDPQSSPGWRGVVRRL